MLFQSNQLLFLITPKKLTRSLLHSPIANLAVHGASGDPQHTGLRKARGLRLTHRAGAPAAGGGQGGAGQD